MSYVKCQKRFLGLLKYGMEFYRAEVTNKCVGVLLLCLFFLKLFIVSGNEILAEQFDQATYAAQSAGYEWAYMSFPPAYPWWLKLSASLGIPQRIAIEGLYFAASVFLFYQLKPYLGPGAFFAFLLIVFGPVTFFMFDSILSEGFYLSLKILAVALSLSCINRPDIYSRGLVSSLLGLVLGVMALTRYELPFLLLWVALLGGVLFAVDCFVSVLSGFVRRAFNALACGAVSAAMIFLVLCLNWTFTYFSEGAFATSLPRLPSHLSLLNKLASIDDGQTQIRFVPVSNKAREMAYEVSPTLRDLRANIEAPDNLWQIASRNSGLPDGEIGAGWIWHTFNAALGSRGITQARAREQFFETVNQELDTAFNNGALKKRRKMVPLLSFGPDPASVIGPSLKSILSLSVSYIAPRDDPQHQTALFDKAANRRASLLTGRGDVFVQGWVAVRGKCLDSVLVEFVRDDGQTLKVMAELFERLDVQKGMLEGGYKDPNVVGFQANIGSNRYQPVSIIYRFCMGEQIVSAGIVEQKMSWLSREDDPQYVIQGVDRVAVSGSISRSGAGYSYQLWVWNVFSSSVWPFFVWVLVGLGLFVSVHAISRRSCRDLYIGSCAYMFLFSIVSTRMAFYFLVDAGAWAVPLRYLQPSALFVFVLAAFSCALLANFIVGFCSGTERKG